MKSAAVLAAILALPGLCSSQDLKLREEAIQILEHANAVSSSPHLPNLERVDTFRAYSGDSIQEGSFRRVVVQGQGRREEYNFGSYSLLNIWTQKQVAVEGKTNQQVLPPELNEVVGNTPIRLPRFDEEDVIHAIANRSLNGRAARCIEFDTVRGQQVQNNELCIDSANGTLVLERLGPELIENSDFFPFAGALMPGKIRYSFAGALREEIAQTMTPLTDPSDALSAPPTAQMHKVGTTQRKPFGVYMPQPKPGSGGGSAEVVVRGTVSRDGRMYNVVVQSSERSDLNAEALALAQQWTFTPPMCDGLPNAEEIDFTLHFQGR